MNDFLCIMYILYYMMSWLLNGIFLNSLYIVVCLSPSLLCEWLYNNLIKTRVVHWSKTCHIVISKTTAFSSIKLYKEKNLVYGAISGGADQHMNISIFNARKHKTINDYFKNLKYIYIKWRLKTYCKSCSKKQSLN